MASAPRQQDLQLKSGLGPARAAVSNAIPTAQTKLQLPFIDDLSVGPRC